MDSLDRATNDHLVLEGALIGVGMTLEEGIPAGGPSNVDEIGEGSPSGVADIHLSNNEEEINR